MFEILILLFPLTGLAFPIYIYVFLKLSLIKIKKWVIPLSNIIYLIFLVIYILVRASNVSFDALFYILTYYFGFLLFFFYFKISRKSIDLYLVLRVLCVEVLIEAFLINTILPASSLFNYPTYTLDSPHYKLFFGFFQRPYSIGANASVTSTLILILYIYVNTKFDLTFKYNLFVFISLLLCLSGTGIALYFIYISFTHFKPKFGSILIFIFLGLFAYNMVAFLEESDFSKFSSLYLNELYDLKIQQINDYMYKLNDTFQVIFGKNHKEKFEVVTFNDFALNDAYYNLGIGGLILLISFIIFNTNINNWIMVVFFLIAALHYGAIFSIFGQFLLGYILNISEEIKVNRY